MSIVLIGLGPGKWYHSKGPYNEASADYECLFFYVDGLYRGDITFEIQYEMNNAALHYGDCSELYLSFFSESSINYLDSFNCQILIPNDDMPSTGNYEVHTYGTNNNDFPLYESEFKNPGYYTFSMYLDNSMLKFKPYNQYLEFSLISFGTDRHIFTDYAPKNHYYNAPVLAELRSEQFDYESTPKRFEKYKFFVFASCLVIAALIIFYTFRKDKKIRKSHIFYKPSIDTIYFRDIPSNLDPAFAAELVFCKQGKKEKKLYSDIYSAIILSLVRKGYIELNRINPVGNWIFSNIKISIKYTPGSITTNNIFNNAVLAEPLTPTEQRMFDLILRHSVGNEISMSLFQSRISNDYENTNSFISSIETAISNIGIYQGYFQKSNYKKIKSSVQNISTFMMAFGIIFITFINLVSYYSRLDLAFGGYTILGLILVISSLYLKHLSKNYVLLTQFGEDEYAKWRGLYNFLNSQTLMNERTVIDLPLWEQYLVYATAFGISDKVISALKIRCPNYESSSLLSNPYYSSTSFRYVGRSFRSATRTAYRTYYSGGSGFSGHGGYGGGGRGGGGGRRRSLTLNLHKIYLAFYVTGLKA